MGIDGGRTSSQRPHTLSLLATSLDRTHSL
ncbi:hypothetical protein PanWU01x14_117780 [Parasponia andersonii]|uniref:Uncharacterized protein n=1 Tax=Parasponia andersonii TaxID=3476 RepID=A0A2P5CW86_PARAD|nr:hypothetical protein PanWU01x14_117780 [Parasponia andersonii]